MTLHLDAWQLIAFATLAAIWIGSMVAVAVMARRAPVDPPWAFDRAADEAVALTREGER